MGGFNINVPGLNFNLTPEAIDAARAAQGLPPLNADPAPVAPPPMAAPAPVPDVQPSIAQGVGSFLLNERFGQNIPVEPRIPAQPAPVAAPPPPPPVVEQAPPPVERTAPPVAVSPVTDQGIGALTTAGIGATQYQGLEGFDPANPLNPVAAPAPDPVFQEPASGSQVVDSSPVDFSSMNPPSGWQGGGGEYNPSNGITDEDRLALGAWDQARQDSRRSQQPVGGPEPTPPPPLVEPPPEDYTEVPDDTVVIVPPEDGDEEPPVTPYDPEPTPDPLPPASDDDDLYTPVPTQPPEDSSDRELRILPMPPDYEYEYTDPDQEVGILPMPSYRYTPYVPAAFQYLIPEFARGRPGASGPGFTGGTSYEEIEAPEIAIPPMEGEVPAYSPVPAFQVARPEYVQIEGPSAPVVDPFATPIQPEFAPLPSYERATYSPQTQKMVDQILSEEEMANPFMNPYLRSGVFGGR